MMWVLFKKIIIVSCILTFQEVAIFARSCKKFPLSWIQKINLNFDIYYEFAESLKIQKSFKKKILLRKIWWLFFNRENIFAIFFLYCIKYTYYTVTIVKSEICTMRFDEDLQGKLLQQQLGWGLLETVVDTQLPSWLIDSRRFAYQTSPSLSNK